MNVELEIVLEENRIRPTLSEVDRLLASNDKAKALLGWAPEYSGHNGLKYGLEKTIEWFSDSKNMTQYKTDTYNI